MKTLQRTIILIILLFSVTVIYSQSITFKKVFPGIVGIDPDGFNIECKPINNNKSFIISAGMLLLKLNSTGDLMLSKTYLHNGYFSHSIFKDNYSLMFYADMISSNKKLYNLDTSLNLISVIQYDSLNWLQATVDRTVLFPTFNKGFLLSGRKGISMPVIVKVDSIGSVIWSKYFVPIQGYIQDFCL